ncbi:arsinothricin resistance N-acetyltransferase ArsN1 family B [Sphingomonas sp. TX0522]|jgi:L-amino acid N-acyltransferase YncA|uniref:arsinothricin resistance N-acetyltransferase ArsN1 family B n=1 Tax=Sphingomonas sp. TX0522 TaxID=2479205 RepID=UPI0018DF942D|nr:arsinothricin resistance N-acetyltransferase ArsN1 family B [Sphingomonas sp. TX0522]MBI0533586.1 N-acetyltransferase family protein [Sphingomonas sp. TX0522]
MSDALMVRSANVADATAIQAIYAPVVESTAISFEEVPPSVAEMEHRIAATLKDYPYLVAERQGEVTGYAYASQHRTRAAYRWSVDVTVYIADQAHRTGVGRALYSKLIAELADRGFHAAFAGIALPNDGSVALHESMGFAPLGIYREVGRKFDRWHDVGWWQRIL